MTTIAQLQDHLRMLKVEDALLLEEGDWDALAQLRMALDATLEDIEALTSKNNNS